jgi:hypothetical protein
VEEFHVEVQRTSSGRYIAWVVGMREHCCALGDSTHEVMSKVIEMFYKVMDKDRPW